MTASRISIRISGWYTPLMKNPEVVGMYICRNQGERMEYQYSVVPRKDDSFMPEIVPVVVRIDKNGRNEYFWKDDPYIGRELLRNIATSGNNSFQGPPALKEDEPQLEELFGILNRFSFIDATKADPSPRRMETIIF